MKLNKNFRGRAFRTASLAALIASIAMPSGVSAFTYPLGSGYLYRQIDGSVTSVTSKYAPTYYNTGNYSASDPLGAATHFHIFASDDVKIGAHTNGNVATKYMSIAGSNSGTNGLDTVNLESEVSYVRDFENINGQILNNGNSPLVVGADVEVDTYNNGNGFTVKGSTMDYPVQMNNSVIKNIFQEVSGGAEYIEMDKEFASLKQLSKGLTTVDATDDESVLDASDNNHRWINLDMSKDYSLIDFDAYQLQQNTDLVLNNYDPDGANSVIINVDLKDFSGNTFDMNSKVYLKTVDGTEVHNKERTTWEYGKILWNFYDSSETDYCYDGSININGVFMGSILAPEAEVAVWQNHDGTTVCRGFENHAQTHRADFTGNMPIIAYSDDETTETTTETTTATVAATTQTTTVATTTETTTQATTANTTEVTTVFETESSTEEDKAAQKDKTTETTTVAATEEATKTKATTGTTVATTAATTTEESTSETTTKNSHSGGSKTTTTTTTTVTTQTTTEQTTEVTTSDNTGDKSGSKDKTTQTTTEVTTETTTLAVDSKETTTVNDVTTEKQTETTTEKQPEITSTEDSASTSTTEEESETTTENITTESTTKKNESETEESTSGQALVVDITETTTEATTETTTQTETSTEVTTEATTEETTETTTNKSSQSSGGSKDKSATTETTTTKEEASTEVTTSIGDAVTDAATETTTVGDGQSSSANKDKNDGDDKSGSASSSGSSSSAVNEETTLTVTESGDDAELATETTTVSGNDSESSVRRTRGGSASNKASVETSSETTTASSKSDSDRNGADPSDVITDSNNVTDNYPVADTNTESDTEVTTDMYVVAVNSDNAEPTDSSASAEEGTTSDNLPQTGSVINTAVMCGLGIGVICLGIFLVIKGKKKAF